MFMKVVAIVFLWYGDKIIKRLRKFEKTDYRLRKAELDLEFLVKCRNNNLIPKFLNFHLANRSLRFSLTYAQCQSNSLLQETRIKKSNVRVLRKEFDNLLSSLQQLIHSIDYAHICSKFLNINDLKLKSDSVVQQKKLCNLLKEKRSTSMFYQIVKSLFLLKVYISVYLVKS